MSVVRDVAITGLVAVTIASCIVHRIGRPPITGTCSGACEHYVECKPAHLDTDRMRCQSECPTVFSDRDSLMAYESLSCKDAVEYVDGNSPKASSR